jgi:FKBP-type peptidyl-prolyl cis-trans isomerase SlyD
MIGYPKKEAFFMTQRVISFHYTLTNRSGEVLDSSKGEKPFAFIEGSGHIVPGLEKQMIGLKIGDKQKIQVQAAEAYGDRIQELVVKVSRKQLPAQTLKKGDRFRGGEGHDARIFTVLEVTDTEATLDGNHPLAGEDLTFDVELMDIRSATPEELDHGHIH